MSLAPAELYASSSAKALVMFGAGGAEPRCSVASGAARRVTLLIWRLANRQVCSPLVMLDFI